MLLFRVFTRSQYRGGSPHPLEGSWGTQGSSTGAGTQARCEHLGTIFFCLFRHWHFCQEEELYTQLLSQLCCFWDYGGIYYSFCQWGVCTCCESRVIFGRNAVSILNFWRHMTEKDNSLAGEVWHCRSGGVEQLFMWNSALQATDVVVYCFYHESLMPFHHPYWNKQTP